eukprot:12915175-Alexandrium_andersonii.AAC.1
MSMNARNAARSGGFGKAEISRGKCAHSPAFLKSEALRKRRALRRRAQKSKALATHNAARCRCTFCAQGA